MAQWFQLEEAPLRVTVRGEWLHGNEPLGSRIAEFFARHVQVNADGSYAVCLGREAVPLQVEDTPFAVKSLATHREGMRLTAVTFSTSDGVEETLDPTTLMQSDANVLYCTVTRGGRKVPCRFAASHYHALALYAEPTAHGSGFELPVGGRRYPIGPFEAAPTVHTSVPRHVVGAAVP